MIGLPQKYSVCTEKRPQNSRDVHCKAIYLHSSQSLHFHSMCLSGASQKHPKAQIYSTELQIRTGPFSSAVTLISLQFM